MRKLIVTEFLTLDGVYEESTLRRSGCFLVIPRAFACQCDPFHAARTKSGERNTVQHAL
jgi:hypothetical protein